MKFKLNKQVEKDLKKIRDKSVLIDFKKFLEKINEVSTVYELNQVNKIKGEKKYFRYRFGDYRVGFKLEGNEILILKLAHRKEIYRYFP